MKLRYRIFLLVGSLFILTLVGGLIARQALVTYDLKLAEEGIKQQIRDTAEREKKDILEYLFRNIAEVEAQIHTIFDRLNTGSWLREKFEPSDINYATNEWNAAATLITVNPWLDLVQITIKDKLAALIMTRPPDMRTLIRIPIDEILSIIVEEQGGDNYIAYIGVPYWNTEEAVSLRLGKYSAGFETYVDKLYWLMFNLVQFQSMEPSKLRAKVTDYSLIPLEAYGAKQGVEEFMAIIEATKGSMKLVQDALKKYPEIVQALKTKEGANQWVKEKLKGFEQKSAPSAAPCKGDLCLKLNEEQRSKYFELMNKWNQRDEQNQLIQAISTITGGGLWNFNPLDPAAPLGICSFLREDNISFQKRIPYAGYGFFSKDVFHTTPLDLKPQCKFLSTGGQFSTCIADQSELLVPQGQDGIFILNTMLFGNEKDLESKEILGSVTAGVNIGPILQELALASSVNIFLMTRENQLLMFGPRGEVTPIPIEEQQEVAKALLENQSQIFHPSGKEYFVFHLTSLYEDKGQIFVVEKKENEDFLINQLRENTDTLIRHIAYQQIIVIVVMLILSFWILNYVLKRVTNPIEGLVAATKTVGEGKLDDVHISASGKARTDEIGILCNAFEKMVAEMKKGEEVRGILNKVVSKEIAEKIVKEGVALGGEMRNVTVLFSDIRNFTGLSEKLAPPDVLEMLNGCLTVLSRVVDESKGVIDKYIGDEIMALFGAPVDIEQPSLQAIQCGRAMILALEKWNGERAKLGQVPLKIGIGIHTGPVIAGNIGAEMHRNYTILGHNVNLASRLCAHAGPMELLITEETLNAPGVRGAIQIETLPPVQLKGISNPVPIFKVII